LTTAAWAVVYYDPPDPAGSAAAFLDDCPAKVDANMTAVLKVVTNGLAPAF